MNDNRCVNAEEASMRIDAVATWPVFGVLCHQLIRIAECVRKRPIPRNQPNALVLPLLGG